MSELQQMYLSGVCAGSIATLAIVVTLAFLLAPFMRSSQISREEERREHNSTR